MTRLQIEYLDTVTEGVEVSRQELGSVGSNHYRWTITFLDEGDDFDLEWSNKQLSTDGATDDDIIISKVLCA